MKIKVEESVFAKPLIPEGLHPAECINIKDTTDGEFGARILMEFKVYYSTNEEPAILSFFAYKKVTINSKFGESLKALGLDLDKEEIDTDEVIGNQCRVMAETYKDKQGDNVSGVTKVKEPDKDTKQKIADAILASANRLNAAKAKQENPKVEEEQI